jgi:subtilase family protein/Big-like domain-containing protein/fervidolysin-like protein
MARHKAEDRGDEMNFQKRSCLRAIFKIVFAALMTTVSLSAQGVPKEQVSSRIIVKFRHDVSPEKVRFILSRNGARSLRVIPHIGVHVVEVSGPGSEKAIAAFKRQAEVESAELDRVVRPSTITPNDPYFYNQPLSEISVPSAWDTTTGSSAVVIAFVDTGVDSTHEDLASKIVSGWNVFNNNSDTSDAGNGHGTWSAGTAAEISNNGLGAAGVCWNCRIMPVRVSDSTGWASMSNIASGITWAADHGARIVNIGFGVDNDPTVMAAAQYLQSRGGLAIAASGNDGLVSSSPDNPYIITVSAIGPFGVPSYANTGSNLDLIAPACNWVATPPGKYYSYSACGTSISSAFVAGVAGLIASWKPNFSPADIRRALQQTADDKGAAGWDSTTGWGEVNAARALAYQPANDVTPPGVNITSPGNASTVAGTISITAVATDNIGVTSVAISAAGTSLCVSSAAPYSCSWNTTLVANGGPYVVTATARDAAGNTASASISVSVNNTTADTTPPTININSPANGSTIGATISISALASDNVGVTSVSISAAGTTLCVLTAAPYSCSWNTTTVPNASYTITATAKDAANNSNTSSLTVFVNNPPPADSTPPTVSITSPANGTIVAGTIQITASAADNVGVSSVTFSVAGATVCAVTTTPYSCTWNSNTVPNGNGYAVTAIARDAAGNINSSSIGLSVNNAPAVDITPPTAIITSPGDGASLSGTVTINVYATDDIGVSAVQVRIDGNAVCGLSNAPWSCSWDSRTVSNGFHTIQATAWDTSGNGTNTATITVSINNVTQPTPINDTTPPVVQFNNPANGATVSGSITVQVSATDDVGVVRLELYIGGRLQISVSTGTLKYKWNVRKLRGGQTLEARAYDAAGNVGTTVISVNVN